MRALCVVLFSLLGACSWVGEQAPGPYDIGVVHREVSTSSAECQLWFDRGLAFCYGFHHEEAVRCFERAAAADPRCAMAHWGKAYALGPNYNATEMPPEACRAAFDSVARARQLQAGSGEVERALIAALAARYPLPEAIDREGPDRAYADAMRKLHERYPNDADVAACTAEAIMQLRPWHLWSHTGEPAPEVAEIRSVLEGGLARWPDHPALCHLYIHAMEAGPEVARALPAARRLETLTPGLGHLVHMPSHIYIWTGRYRDAVRVNQQAVACDRAFEREVQVDLGYTLYKMHNYHFIAYGAMWSGQRAVALRAARELVADIPAAALAEMIDLTDIFTATPLHVMVRFGMWQEVLAEPEPRPELLAHRAVWHYARGIALAVSGDVDAAAREQQLFRAARAEVPASRLLFNNPVEQILAVADEVLAGELQYRRGNLAEAFRHLRAAVDLDDRLNYDEPWGWMEPARHALGALLLEQGRVAEAERVYRADLRRYPDNGWALHGLAECLRLQARDEQASAVERQFERAWSHADVELPGSCFCRTLAAR